MYMTPERRAYLTRKAKEYRDKKKDLGSLEKESVVETKLGGSDVVTSDPALPWPLNPSKSPRWGEGVAHYIAPTDEEKEAMDRLGLEKSRILREERKKK